MPRRIVLPETRVVECRRRYIAFSQRLCHFRLSLPETYPRRRSVVASERQDSLRRYMHRVLYNISYEVGTVDCLLTMVGGVVI